MSCVQQGSYVEQSLKHIGFVSIYASMITKARKGNMPNCRLVLNTPLRSDTYPSAQISSAKASRMTNFQTYSKQHIK